MYQAPNLATAAAAAILVLSLIIFALGVRRGVRKERDRQARRRRQELSQGSRRSESRLVATEQLS